MPERMWSVNVEELVSGENETTGAHYCWPSESLGSRMTRSGVPWE